MKENSNHSRGLDKEILFSRSIKAGKRIYYIDVKQNSRNEMYLSLTESKKIVSGDADMPQFSYENKWNSAKSQNVMTSSSMN